MRHFPSIAPPASDAFNACVKIAPPLLRIAGACTFALTQDSDTVGQALVPGTNDSPQTSLIATLFLMLPIHGLRAVGQEPGCFSNRRQKLPHPFRLDGPLLPVGKVVANI